MGVGIDDLVSRRANPGRRLSTSLLGLRASWVVINPILGSASATAWTDQPAAVTFFGGFTTGKWKMDLSHYSQYRLLAHVATIGHTTAVLDLRYFLTASVTASDYITVAESGGTLSLAATGFVSTAWLPMRDAASDDVYLAIMGSGGNATADPALAYLEVQFRS